MADTPPGDFACCAPAVRQAAANVPLVIVNPARDFTLMIYDDTSELICPLCEAGPRPAPVQMSGEGCLRISEPATVGQMVDLALAHIAAAHPEHLVPAPVVLGRVSDLFPPRVVNVGDTVTAGADPADVLRWGFTTDHTSRDARPDPTL